MLADYDRGLNWVFRHQLITLLVTLALDRGDRLSLLRHPKRISPGAGHRLSVRPTRGAAGRILSRQWRSSRIRSSKIVIQDPAVSGMVSFAGARPAAIRARTPPACSSSSSRSDSAPAIEEVIGRLRPKVAQVIGAQFYHASRSGHHGRRTPGTGAISIHPDRHRLRRTQSLGADLAVEDAIDEDFVPTSPPTSRSPRRKSTSRSIATPRRLTA